MYTNEELNTKVHELRELKRAAETISSRIKNLEDEIKSHMTETSTYELQGDDWKITWKEVVSNRFNQSIFKDAHPDLFKRYLTESSSRRFLLG